MEVILYYPKSKEAQGELEKAVAMVHADLVANLVNSLPCTEEQKCTLIKSVSDECHKKTDNFTPLR